MSAEPPEPGRTMPPGPSPEAAPDAAPGPDAPEDAPAPPPHGRVQRAREFAAHMRTQATSAYEDAQSRRESSSAIDTAFRAIERDIRSGGAVLAGALAFRLFMFMIPYVFVLVVGFGAFSDITRQSATSAARSVGITGLVAGTIADAARISGWQRVASLGIGTFALFLAARSLVKVLRTTHSLVWRLPPAKRPTTNRGALALIGLTAASTVLVGALGWARTRNDVVGLVFLALFTLIPFGIWWYVTWVLPHASPMRWIELVPGAVVFALGVQALHLFTLYWIAREVSVKSARYGALGASLALLLWAYCLGRIIILGAVVNAALWSRRERDQLPGPTL